MPLYLVRWPMFAASLVSAVDEDDLLDRLDEQADAEGCVWEEYDGPVYVDFNLPVTVRDRDDAGDGQAGQPFHPMQVEIEPAVTLLNERVEIEMPQADTAAEMVEAVLKFAFPHVADVFEIHDEPSLDDFQPALRKELERAAQASWRREARNRSTDPDAQIARAIGAPIRLVKYWQSQAEQREAADGDDDEIFSGESPGDDTFESERALRVPPAENMAAMQSAEGWILRYVDDDMTMYVDQPIACWGIGRGEIGPASPCAEALIAEPEGLVRAAVEVSFDSVAFRRHWMYRDTKRWRSLVSDPSGPTDWPRFIQGENADKDVPDHLLFTDPAPEPKD